MHCSHGASSTIELPDYSVIVLQHWNYRDDSSTEYVEYRALHVRMEIVARFIKLHAQ